MSSKQLSNRSISKKGFTLIELMIVIAIIAILMALATFSFRNIRRKIRKTACRENQRIIFNAAILCQTENPRMDSKNITVGYLDNNGYLRKKIKCPSGGSYSITGEEENLTVSCFKTLSGVDHGCYQETPKDKKQTK